MPIIATRKKTPNKDKDRRRTNAPASGGITWDDAIDKFDIYLRAARKSLATIHEYLPSVRAVEAFVAGRRTPAPLPADVNVQDLREYLCGLLDGKASRSGRPLKASTTAKCAAEFSSFFQFLYEEELIREDPTLRLDRPKVPKAVPGDVLTVREVEKLLGACDTMTPHGLRDRALVELLYGTGLRNGEALALDLGDFDRDEREVIVRKGKGEKGRTVPMTRSAWAEVMAYLERGRPALATKHKDSQSAVFVTRTGRRLETSGFRFLLLRLKERAKVKTHITPHTFRRTMATHLMKAGASIRQIQEILGHEHLNTTAVYLKLTTDELREMLHLKHPRERLDV
jgi:site-specific recombinase XerD